MCKKSGCVKTVYEYVKKVDGCAMNVSVCESHVRDCVRRESMGKLERKERRD